MQVFCLDFWKIYFLGNMPFPGVNLSKLGFLFQPFRSYSPINHKRQRRLTTMHLDIQFETLSFQS